MNKVLAILAVAFASQAVLAAEASFSAKPTATKAGDKVKVDFAVSRECDVAVFIEDAGGKVVRHLVAGVLGKNPPPPFKANALSQTIEWNGKDDFGKPAAGGPFKVRVALGLGAKYDRILLGGEPKDGIAGGPCLATGPDGTLYTFAGFGAGGPTWGGLKMIAINRDGTYQKTLWPCPASLTKEQMQAWGATVMDLDGRPAPVVSTIKNQNFIGVGVPRKGGMAVTADGVILTASGSGGIAAVDANGIPAWGQRVGPVLVAGARFPDGSKKAGRADIAVSSDGKFAYVSGLKSAVYKVPLPARGPAEPFFGDPNKPGNDETHLGDALRGVAADGKGNLLIADFTNNRVVVSEKDGKFAGSFPMTAPDCLAVDPATGAVYLTRLAGGNVELVKLQSWKEPKELGKLSVPPEGNRDYPWSMALDAAGKPPVVWMSADGGGLLRIEDQGARFADAKRLNSGHLGDGAFVDISVDRFRHDPEIYVRGAKYWWFRYDEKTGQFSQVRLPVGANDGSCLVPGAGGNIYALGYPFKMCRFDRNGAPLAWEDPHRREVIVPESGGKKYAWRPQDCYVPVSMTYMTHTLGVRYDGHIFTLEPKTPGGRPPKMLVEYEPSGKRIDKPIVWKVSDVAVGPKFDPQGNIYIAEHLNPIGQSYPPEYQAALGPMWKERPANWSSEPRYVAGQLYGSIIKFSPRGGMVHWTGVDEATPGMNPMGLDPFTGQPQLDPELKKTEVQYIHPYGNIGKVAVTGAEWIHTGIGHIEMFGCNCQNVRFDVDEFGRVWYPDLGRFRVAVLDTNGNDITYFGGYGNADSRGPESKDKALAEPEIAFAWLMGVGVTDKYAYMGDSMNARFLRAKLVYAAEETCEIK